MGLIDLKTDLKSLKYGKDTLGGGYSGQPYIQTSIPDSTNSLGPREDFLLRGGAVGAAADAATDIRRLTKMFTDTKSPNGTLFVAKQQLLSRTAPRTQTSGILNEGNYTPLSTLAQAGVVAFGGHLNKQGDPFSETGAYANNENLYFTKVKNYNQDWLDSPDGSLKNRLFALYESKIQNNEIGGFAKTSNISNLPTEILYYTGGPGSDIGAGNTSIKFADQRTGKNNPLAVNSRAYFFGDGSSKIYQPGNYLRNIYSTDNNKGVSGKYARLTNIDITNAYNPDGTIGGYYNFNVYEPTTEGNTWPKNSPLIYKNSTFTYNQQDIIKPYEIVKTGPNNPTTTSEKQGSIISPKIQDFRKILRNNLGSLKDQDGRTSTTSGATPLAPNYSTANYELRTNLGQPGQRSGKSYADYTAGINYSPQSVGKTIKLGSFKPGLDKINSLPIYRSENVTQDSVVNDLVKFRIAIIDNDSPSFKTFIHFRAFLDSMSDSYNATWDGFQYLGRGEQFYTYKGFTRQISLGWTVAAQSKQELIPMYKKLNYLASSLTPDYSPKGYMRGVLCQLTVGGYLYEQPGFITSLTYTVPTESPWEIAIKADDEATPDNSVKELPHIIQVTGFSFTPIQRFLPQIQKNTYTFNNGTISNTNDDTGFVSKYGGQRYIALSNGISGSSNNNYDS